MDGFKKLLLSFLLLPVLAGCCPLREPAGNPYRVVTQVDILYTNGSMQTLRHFFNEENIRQIVDYLRYIDPYGLPQEDPEQLQDRCYEITLVYSDGFQYRYQQRADRYMRIENGPWQRIDPQKALYLSGIFGMMTGELPSETAPMPSLLQPQL